MQPVYAEDGAFNASVLVQDSQVILFNFGMQSQSQFRSQVYCRRQQSLSPIGCSYIGIRKSRVARSAL